jgi:hypothetical protein
LDRLFEDGRVTSNLAVAVKSAARPSRREVLGYEVFGDALLVLIGEVHLENIVGDVITNVSVRPDHAPDDGG